MLQRMKQHRADVRRSRLQEIAEERQIVLDVAQCAGAGHESQDRRQMICELKVLRPTMAVPVVIFLPVAARLSPNPGANRVKDAICFSLLLCPPGSWRRCAALTLRPGSFA